ncbi:hypothetical protein ACQP2K_29690 [Microbispora siamensis]
MAACRRAVDEADVTAAQVDLLSGYVTVSEFLASHDDDGVPDGMGRPVYRIEPHSGIAAFRSTGMDGPPDLIHRLLDRNGVPPQEVTVIGHQASDVLLDRWRQRLRPARVLDTLSRYGKLVVASAAVTLDSYAGLIDTPYLVLFGLGIGSYQIAMPIRM